MPEPLVALTPARARAYGMPALDEPRLAAALEGLELAEGTPPALVAAVAEVVGWTLALGSDPAR